MPIWYRGFEEDAILVARPVYDAKLAECKGSRSGEGSDIHHDAGDVRFGIERVAVSRVGDDLEVDTVGLLVEHSKVEGERARAREKQ